MTLTNDATPEHEELRQKLSELDWDLMGLEASIESAREYAFEDGEKGNLLASLDDASSQLQEIKNAIHEMVSQ